MHVGCLLTTRGIGMFKNPSFMPGPLTLVFVRLHNCMLDLLDRQYIVESLPGVGS